MKNELTFASLILLAAGAFVPATASAYGLHICNKTSDTLYIAVGVLTDTPGSPQEQRDEDLGLVGGGVYARTYGWWTIAPGHCSTPMSQPLRKSDVYYYWAHDSNGGTWDGDEPMCVVSGQAFNLNTTHAAMDCPDEEKRNFRKIATQSYSDYTLNLNP